MEKPFTEITFTKLVKHAETPYRATKGAAGFDLVATDYYYDADKDYHQYGTGIAVDLPVGWEIEVRPRSSIRNTSFTLINSPGTIDSDYKKEIFVTFKTVDEREKFYYVGDRIAQLVFKKVPQIQLTEVASIEQNGRGGFGSTNR